MRWFLLALSTSDESLLASGTVIFALLSLAAVIWPKFAGLVRTMYGDLRDAIRELRRFRRELTQSDSDFRT